MMAALLDQGSQSIVNLILTVAVARRLTPDDFGRFAVVFVILVSIHGLLRVGFVEAYLIRCGSSTTAASSSSRALEKMLIRTALVISAVSVAVGVVTNVQSSFVAFLAASIVVNAGLEAVRGSAIATNNRKATISIATAWLSSLSLGWIIVEIQNYSVNSVLAMYVGGTTLAYFVGSLLADRSAEADGGSLGWSDVRSDGLPLALEHSLTLVSVQGIVPIVAAVSTFEQAAGYRGALTIAAPLTTLVAGSRIGILTDATRFRDAEGGPRPWARYFFRSTMLLVVMSGVAAALMLVVAQQFGSELLGDTWEFAEDPSAPILVGVVASAVHLVGSTVLRTRQMTRKLFVARLVTTAVLFPPQIVGAVLNGATGAAVGFAVGSAVAIPVWWKLSTAVVPDQ